MPQIQNVVSVISSKHLSNFAYFMMIGKMERYNALNCDLFKWPRLISSKRRNMLSVNNKNPRQELMLCYKANQSSSAYHYCADYVMVGT